MPLTDTIVAPDKMDRICRELRAVIQAHGVRVHALAFLVVHEDQTSISVGYDDPCALAGLQTTGLALSVLSDPEVQAV